MAKQMAEFVSAHQIGLSTCMEDVLIVVGGSSSLDFKKQRNWSRFNLYLHNQGRYGKTDGRIGFRASNRFIHILGRCSNCSWGLFVRGSKKAKSKTSSGIPQQPAIVMGNGLRHLIRRAN